MAISQPDNCFKIHVEFEQRKHKIHKLLPQCRKVLVWLKGHGLTPLFKKKWYSTTVELVYSLGKRSKPPHGPVFLWRERRKIQGEETSSEQGRFRKTKAAEYRRYGIAHSAKVLWTRTPPGICYYFSSTFYHAKYFRRPKPAFFC